MVSDSRLSPAVSDAPRDILVLYVDDDRSLLEVTKAYIEAEDDSIAVRTANGAEEALEELNSEQFDAVVSDYQMPRMDGLDLLQTLREGRESTIPFIIFTGRGREEVAIEALNLGADRYLQKGGDPTSQYQVLTDAIRQEVRHSRTQAALEARKENLRITLESIGDAVIATDDTGNVERMNGVAENLTGWDRDAAIGRPLSDVFEISDQDSGESIASPVAKVLEEGTVVDITNGTVLHSRDGTDRYIADSAAPITNASGSIVGVVLVFRDITEKYVTRRRQQRQRETVIELATDEAVVEGRIEVAARRITEAIAGATAVDRSSIWLYSDDKETLSCLDLYNTVTGAHESAPDLHAEDHPRYFEALKTHRAIPAEDARSDPRTAGLCETYLEPLDIRSMLDATIRKEGDVIGVLCNEVVGEKREWASDEIRFAGEVADQFVLALTNEEQRERELALEQQNEQLEVLFERSPMGVIELNAEFEITRWNEPAGEIFGYDAEAAIGKHVSALVPDSTVDQVDAAWSEVLGRKTVEPYTEWNVTADGAERCCEWYVRSVVTDETVNVLAFVSDVTEQRQRSRQLETIAQKTEDAIFIKDVHGEYEFINRAGAAFFGLTPREVRGRRDAELFDLPDGEELFETDKTVLETESSVVEEERSVIAGEEHVFLAEKHPYYNDEGDVIGIIGISRDITEQKRLEQLLLTFHKRATDDSLSREERISALLEAVRTGLEVENAHVVRIRRATDSHEILDVVGNESLTPVGTVSPLEATYCRLVADGEGTVVFEHAGEEGMAGDPAYEAFGLETYIGSPITVDGDFWGTVCFADRKPRDESFAETALTIAKLSAEWIGNELAEQMRERELEQRSEMLEELVGVLAHDLQSQAVTAQGYIELAQSGASSKSLTQASKSIGDLQSLIREAATVVEQRLGETQQADVSAVSLGDAVQGAKGRLDGEPVSVVHDAGVADARIRVANGPGPLQLLFQNLFENAIRHNDDPVTVRVGLTSDGNGFYVADDGVGIPEAEQETVFETGYTTHSDGTGLGLTIVQLVAMGNAWSVHVDRSDDGGARFTFDGVSFGD